VERILIGLPDFTIQKIVSVHPAVIEVEYTGQPSCPHCRSRALRLKDSFWRFIRNVPVRGRSSLLQVRCHKHLCNECGRYFNTRLPGVKKWGRSTELLKREVFRAYNNGYSNKAIARENSIGVASAERYYHQVITAKVSHRKSKIWPRILGIDEHRFTRRKGFLTTFCDLGKHKVLDIAEGRSELELQTFLNSMKGRKRVEVVCIDMNSAYRKMVRRWFPNARIVADRFHVVRLVNLHFSKACKLIDEEHLAYGRGGLMRLLQTRRDRLTPKQKSKLQGYLRSQPVIAGMYDFCQDLNELLRVKGINKSACRKLVAELLEKITQLKQAPFAPLKTLGRTLYNWREEVACMFRYTRSNGITEGFHRKMKLIQRRAYGFRNFENYCLRIKVLCG
jgi:transposase